ncbi:hypothetical protein NQ314_001903 [Rhamnusium bicolor]|uniref:Uncharacterized protein n=1 Tax=Rhamnusium bicolor TaxID=1586634 RepID=A0AAV8ZQR5_9CUCU|nr:hypothetical protein NQ314_001903 [Rhamnusium bicolor]
MKSYILVWYEIKKNKSFTDGSKYVFKAIQTSMPYNLLQIVDPISECNAFFANPKTSFLQWLSMNNDVYKKLD